MPEDRIYRYELYLTAREREALNELADMDQVHPTRIFIQALRMYQLVRLKKADIVIQHDPGEPIGCGSDDADLSDIMDQAKKTVSPIIERERAYELVDASVMDARYR